jgi:hypothetical protein
VDMAFAGGDLTSITSTRRTTWVRALTGLTPSSRQGQPN